VLVRFPFSDLSGAKLRPAVVLAITEHGDRLLCQVTSNPWGDKTAIPVTPGNFASGTLRLVSFARPGKLFTAGQSLLVSEVGILTTELRVRIVESIVKPKFLGQKS
jgi:mRNA interferase MazF